MLLKLISNTVLIKVLGASLFFIYQVVLARLLGAESTGAYLLIIMIATIMATVMRMGMESPLLKFVAIAASETNWSAVHEVYRVAFRALAASSILGGLVILVYIGLHDPFKLGVGDEGVWAVPLLLVLSLTTLQTQSLMGIGKSYWGAAIQQSIPAGVSLFFIFLLVPFWGLSGALVGTFLGWFIAYLIGRWVWYQSVPAIRQGGKREEFSFKTLWSSSRPLAWATIATQLNQWMIIGMSSIWLPHDEVGQLGMAQRAAMIVSFILGAVNIVTNPRYAVLYQNKKIDDMAIMARKISLIMFFISIPIFCIGLYFSNEIMRIFGDQFASASNVFIILMGGQLVNAVCGSVGFILMMSGFEKDVRNIIVCICLVSVFLHYFLILSNGMLGAAIATASTVVLWNILMTWMVWFRLGFIPLAILPIKTSMTKDV